MKYEELVQLVNNNNETMELTLEHAYDKKKPKLKFNYSYHIDIPTLSESINLILNTAIENPDLTIDDKAEYINYTASEVSTVYIILKLFTDLDLNGDVNLAYRLNMEYNIINILAEENQVLQGYINNIYNLVWKNLELKKASKASDAIDKIFYNIQSLFASFGLSKLNEHNIDINDFVDNYIKNEELKALEETEKK